MAKIAQKIKENPKLCQLSMADGRQSLYLEYYIGREQEPVLDHAGDIVLYEKGKMAGTPKYKIRHIRKKEHLNLYLIKARTPEEREQNNKTLKLAIEIRNEREQEFIKDKFGYRLEKERRMNYLTFYEDFIAKYQKKDIRNIKLALKRFRDFLTQEHPKYVDFITPEQIDADMIRAFVAYLQARSYGSGAHTLYERFKKVAKYAYEHGIFKQNPCTGIVCAVDKQILLKDILSIEEIQRLIDTENYGENKNIRRAFLISLFCGIRYCDVKDLTYQNVDFQNKLLKFEQDKTKGHSSHSGVVIPLDDFLLSIIGDEPADKNQRIFELPSHTMCLKALRHWTARAGIQKHITWHCARHSFAVNILNNGANIKTVASLLGHSGLSQVEKYTRAVDELKIRAVHGLTKLINR